MEDLKVKTTQSINDFNKSVQKLNLYSDRLILAAEKESLNPKQIHSLDEKAVIDATHQAAEFIISYAKLLDTVKAVESKNKVHKPVTYTEYKEQTLEVIEQTSTDVTRLKQFQEYTGKLADSIRLRKVQMEMDSSMDDRSGTSFSSF